MSVATTMATGNHAPAINGGNIDRGVEDFDNGVRRACRCQGRWRGAGGNTSSGSGNGARKRKHSKANRGGGN